MADREDKDIDTSDIPELDDAFLNKANIPPETAGNIAVG
jgi:hypothetical protein